MSAATFKLDVGFVVTAGHTGLRQQLVGRWAFIVVGNEYHSVLFERTMRRLQRSWSRRVRHITDGGDAS